MPHQIENAGGSDGTIGPSRQTGNPVLYGAQGADRAGTELPDGEEQLLCARYDQNHQPGNDKIARSHRPFHGVRTAAGSGPSGGIVWRTDGAAS